MLSPDEFEHLADKFLPAPLCQVPDSVPIVQMPRIVGIAARALERAFLRDFNGQKWAVPPQDASPRREDCLCAHLNPFLLYDQNCLHRSQGGPEGRSPTGRGGGRASASLPLLFDVPASPASRRLASARPALAPKCNLYLLPGP